MLGNFLGAKEHVPLPGLGAISLFHQWLSPSESRQLFALLLQSAPWRQPDIRIAGALKKIPRLQVWYGEKGSDFRYSGVNFQPLPMPAALIELTRKIESVCASTFNSVLVNLYRDENDSVGWHADDEDEFGERPVIASLSLGAERRFLLKPKPFFQASANWKPRQRSIAVPLADGDLMLMNGHVQPHWLHCVPKEKNTTKPRINLTFRAVLKTNVKRS